jgi:hypothetical protein
MTPADERKALHLADAQALRGSQGECGILAHDEQPDLLGIFRADPLAGEH